MIKEVLQQLEPLDAQIDALCSIQAKTDRNINVTGLENLQTPQASAPTAETTADHATVTE